MHEMILLNVCYDPKCSSSRRVPGEEIDEMLHFDSQESRHIVVWRQGLFYQLSIYDDKNQLLSVTVLEKYFQDIIDDANKHKGMPAYSCGKIDLFWLLVCILVCPLSSGQ